MNTLQITAQIDSLLTEVERARRASQHDDLSGGLLEDELVKIHTRLMSAIERFSPLGSTYIVQARASVGGGGHLVLQLGGILGALKSDLEAGYIDTIEELIHGVVFDDLLEMATELLTKGYKDPAAVIAGSVLEEHARKLALRNNLNLINVKGKPRGFDDLAIELVKAGQFSEPQRKILAGWYAQRNEAAHGHYANVVESEVGRMIEGVRDFMTRFPA